MIAESVFHIKCFNDVKFGVENQFYGTLKYIEISKHFIQYDDYHFNP